MCPTDLEPYPDSEANAIRFFFRCERILRRAKALSNNLIPGSDMQTLVDKLAAYLVERRNESYNGPLSIARRVDFVECCFHAISTKNQPELDALLADENIKPFKGCFSQSLYDTVKPFQFFCAKRQEEIVQAVPSLPGTLIEVIAGYDKGLHCHPDDPPAADLLEEGEGESVVPLGNK